MVFERFGRDPGWNGFIAEFASLFVPAQNTTKKFIHVNLNTHISIYIYINIMSKDVNLCLKEKFLVIYSHH